LEEAERMKHILALQNDKGASLMELVTGLAASAVLFLVAMFLMSWSSNAFQELERRARAQRDSLEAAYYLKNLMGLAVDVRSPPNAALAANLTGYTVDYTAAAPVNGVIRSYDSLQSATAAGATDTIGIFVRETGGSTIAGGFTSYAPTGVFFQLPTPTQSARLTIDIGGPAGAPSTLAPDTSDFYFDNISEFRITLEDQPVLPWPTGTFALDRPIRWATVRIVFRVFSDSGMDSLGARQYRWCPSSKIATNVACQGGLPYKDIERVFTVYFRNNDIDPTFMNVGTMAPRRLFGNLHFFKLFVPFGFEANP
jgi:hypothetical protein